MCRTEFYIGGGKLSLLSGEKAKFSAESLKAKLEVKSPAPPVHHSPAAAVASPKLQRWDQFTP